MLQQALLKLREQALVEKAKAEMAWVDQQKQQLRSKGADDAFPRLKQKERGIMRRLKQEKTDLKKLQEAQKAASRKRILMFKESQEIVNMQKSTQQVIKAFSYIYTKISIIILELNVEKFEILYMTISWICDAVKYHWACTSVSDIFDICHEKFYRTFYKFHKIIMQIRLPIK